MIGKDFDGVPKDNVAVLLQCLHDAEQFSLSRGVPGLSRIQLAAVESDRLSSLRDDCSQLIVTSVRVNLKRLHTKGGV